MTAGVWTDMSYAAGIPVANYYASAPYVATALNGNEGILAGPLVNPSHRKWLHKALLMPVAAIGQAAFLIHDIVMVYPFIDGDGGEQLLDNAISIPRYAGLGCKIMLVSQGAGVSGAVDTQIEYTDADGNTGRIWQGFTANANSAGQVISGPNDGTAASVRNASPYILLQGDRGVRSVERVNMQTGAGGIFAVCIVKPLGTISMQINETTPIEVDFSRDRLVMREVEDGAYVHLIGRSSSSASPANLHGQFDFIWTPS